MRTALAASLLLPLLVACADPAPLAPSLDDTSASPSVGAPAALVAAAASVPDISGTWAQQRELFIHLADWAAPLFGVLPEGTRTTLRCSATGTVQIAQNGSTFTGTYTEQGACTTAGGQSTMLDSAGELHGEISGRSVTMLAIGEPGPVECPQRGSIRVQNGIAVEISGMGHCIEPGHPHSLVQVPGPRAGPNLTRWVFRR